MADFCKQCSLIVWGEDYGDLANLCKAGEMASVLCEHCGPTWVDCNGRCIGNCIEDHIKETTK